MKAWLTAIAVAFAACVGYPAQAASRHSTEGAEFSAGVPAVHGSGQNLKPAAIVDGHVIPIHDVLAVCLRHDRAHIVDQMVQNYVVDRDCAGRGIVVSEKDIEKRLEMLRKSIAPHTIDELIAQRHTTMAALRYDIKQEIERTLLVTGQVKPLPMAHCRVIAVKYRHDKIPVSAGGPQRTKDDAQALMADIQTQLKAGKGFGDLAGQYSELGSKGDIGIVYAGMRDVDPTVVNVALALGNGVVAPRAVETSDALILVQSISKNDDHPKDEDQLYADALDLYRGQQAQFLAPKYVVDLIDKSKIIFATDAELNVSEDKLPAAAATVDGHVIPAKDVVAACLVDAGPSVVDMLVQNYVVDQECKHRGIAVDEVDVDRRVESLRKKIAPHTIDEGLKMHDMTMDALRYDFRQELERIRLVADRIPSAPMTHCRAIAIKYCPTGVSEDIAGTKRTEAEAQAVIGDIQSQLKAGKDFGGLADRYSENMPKAAQGDIGILYAGMNDIDTAVLDAGLGLKRGEVYAQPIKTAGAYYLIQGVSMSSDHPSSEAAIYADGLKAYKEHQAPRLIPQTIADLVKKSKVVKYLGA